ncbi:MAG: HAD family hydrolase [Candidatus Acidiferrales bacterium]
MKQIQTQISCSGLLFDMDGVLLDSTPAVARVWHQWAIEHGLNPEEVVRAAHGRPSISTIRDYLPGSDYEVENREVERRELADLEGIAPWPGAIGLLKSLPPDRWAIVTSCTRPLAEVRIRAGGLPRPRFFITSDDIRNGKPAPDPYLKGAEMLGLNPSDCIVVEDVPAGVRSGKAAGCRVIALCTTMPEADLRNAGADWVVKDCSAISLVAAEVREGKLALALQVKEPATALK